MEGKVGDLVTLSESCAIQHFTEPPPRFFWRNYSKDIQPSSLNHLMGSAMDILFCCKLIVDSPVGLFYAILQQCGGQGVSNTYLVARFVFHCLSSQCLCLFLHASLNYQCWLRVQIVVEGILSCQACSIPCLRITPSCVLSWRAIFSKVCDSWVICSHARFWTICHSQEFCLKK